MYKIIPDHSISTLTIPAHSTLSHLLSSREHTTFKYGLKACQLHVVRDNFLADHQISLSTHSIEELSIPLEPLFDINVNEQLELTIGPCIGVMAALTSKGLTNMVSTLTSYVRNYSEIGGTIIAFSLDGVDMESQMLNGYLYNPLKKEWVKGLYAYPSSIFSIVEASLTKRWNTYQSIMQHFHTILGNKLFNFPNFSKWDMYNMLIDDFPDYLPETVLYRSPLNIWEFLNQHGSIFIKPVNGRLGRYVCKVMRTNQGILVEERQLSTTIKSKKQLEHFFLNKLRKGDYLLQKSIDLLTYKERVMDLRIIMVKDQNKQWKLLEIITRFGESGSIVSNISAGGKAEIASKTFRDRFNFSEEVQSSLFQTIKHLAIEAIKSIENEGYHCGNIGFDIGIDKNLHPWIIEINNQNPDHYIAFAAKSRSLFYYARFLNMIYAKRLAGFN